MDFTNIDQSMLLMKMGMPIDSANCYYAYRNGLYGSPLYRPINFSFEDLALKHLDAQAIIPCWTVGRLIKIAIRATQRPLTISYSNIDDLVEFMISIIKYYPQIKFEDEGSFISKEIVMKKSDYCSAMHGDPYPPCWNPNWKCKDCANREKQRRQAPPSTLKVEIQRL